MEVFIAVHSNEPPHYWDLLPDLANLDICPEHFEQMLFLTESLVEWRGLVGDLLKWHPYQWRREEYKQEFKEIGKSRFFSICTQWSCLLEFVIVSWLCLRLPTTY